MIGMGPIRASAAPPAGATTSYTRGQRFWVSFPQGHGLTGA